ncbi:MAG: hypothetical protein RL654_2057 [Pseudomonadota bacterium]|jgi:flagellar FliL protein
MSAAAASAEQPAPKKNSKKLFIIIGVVVVLLLGGGGAGFMIWKKKAAEAAAAAAEEGGEDAHAVAKPKPAKRDPKLPPAYMPLDPFVVNLADRDADRYAQIGVTLEIDDPKFAEEMKPYMPAVRNAVLMILSHKTAAELQGREGKELLAAEIAREVVRPMGINIDDEGEDDGKKKRKRTPVYNPVQQVHFSSFIVQ